MHQRSSNYMTNTWKWHCQVHVKLIFAGPTTNCHHINSKIIIFICPDSATHSSEAIIRSDLCDYCCSKMSLSWEAIDASLRQLVSPTLAMQVQRNRSRQIDLQSSGSNEHGTIE